MKRKNIVKLDSEEVVLESQKEFSEFRKRYNKYNFMQTSQISTWETKLKEPGPDFVPEPTNGEIMKLLLEFKNDIREIKRKLDRHEERMNKHWGANN